MADRPRESFFEQLQRLRAASVSPGSLPTQFPAHPVFGELERPFVCRGCGRTILVGPCFDHVDPDEFLGAVCGCAERAGTVIREWPRDETGQDGTGRTPVEAPATAGAVGNARQEASG